MRKPSFTRAVGAQPDRKRLRAPSAPQFDHTSSRLPSNDWNAAGRRPRARRSRSRPRCGSTRSARARGSAQVGTRPRGRSERAIEVVGCTGARLERERDHTVTAAVGLALLRRGARGARRGVVLEHPLVGIQLVDAPGAQRHHREHGHALHHRVAAKQPPFLRRTPPSPRLCGAVGGYSTGHDRCVASPVACDPASRPRTSPRHAWWM
jgi:hypothetical protein